MRSKLQDRLKPHSRSNRESRINKQAQLPTTNLIKKKKIPLCDKATPGLQEFQVLGVFTLNLLPSREKRENGSTGVPPVSEASSGYNYNSRLRRWGNVYQYQFYQNLYLEEETFRYGFPIQLGMRNRLETQPHSRSNRESRINKWVHLPGLN